MLQWVFRLESERIHIGLYFAIPTLALGLHFAETAAGNRIYQRYRLEKSILALAIMCS